MAAIFQQQNPIYPRERTSTTVAAIFAPALVPGSTGPVSTQTTPTNLPFPFQSVPAPAPPASLPLPVLAPAPLLPPSSLPLPASLSFVFPEPVTMPLATIAFLICSKANIRLGS